MWEERKEVACDGLASVGRGQQEEKKGAPRVCASAARAESGDGDGDADRDADEADDKKLYQDYLYQTLRFQYGGSIEAFSYAKHEERLVRVHLKTEPQGATPWRFHHIASFGAEFETSDTKPPIDLLWSRGSDDNGVTVEGLNHYDLLIRGQPARRA